MSPKVGVAPLRREQIVRATIRCLARDGYTGLTMKKVARAAGVSQGILHYYFADKRAILVAALAAVTADLDRRVATAQARGSREPRTRLRALITACLRLAVEEREFWIVFVEFWGEMMHDRRLRELNAALYERMRRQIGTLIAQGIRAGTFRRVDRLQAAAVILALVDGVSLQLTFDPKAFGIATAVQFCDDALPREGGIMSLDHEAQAKERAREYFRTKGTQLPVPVIRERIADAVRALDEFLAPLSAEQAARVTVRGEWTIHEIVDHLIETYRPGLDELWCLLAGRRPPGEPIPAGLQSKAPLLRPWPWLRDELRRVHAEVLKTLDAVPPDFRTDAKAPLVMVVNVKDAQEKTTPLTWVEDLDWKSYAIVSWRLHAIDHLNHARKVLAAAGT